MCNSFSHRCSITAFPVLLTIGIYERSRREGPQRIIERISSIIDKVPRRLRPLSKNIVSECLALVLMAIAAFLEGLSRQGSDIDAIFEIEAQVVDDVLNENTRSMAAGDVASKPQSPSRSRSPPGKPANKETHSDSWIAPCSCPKFGVVTGATDRIPEFGIRIWFAAWPTPI